MNRSEQVVAIVRACQASCGNGKSPAWRDLTKKVSAILDQGDTTVREVCDRLEAFRHEAHIRLCADGSGYLASNLAGQYGTGQITSWGLGYGDPITFALDQLISERCRKAEQQTDAMLMREREPGRCVDVVRGCAKCNFPTGDIKVEIVPGPPPDGCIEDKPPARPVPRVEAPGGHEYVYRDGNGVVQYFNQYCRPVVEPSYDQMWEHVVNMRVNTFGWRYIGPVNDGDLDPDSVPEQQADPVAEFRAALDEDGVEGVQVQSLEDKMAEVELADITPSNEELLAKAKDPPADRLDEPANDLRLNEIQAAIDVANKVPGNSCHVRLYGHGEYGIVKDGKIVATDAGGPNPVTAIRRLTSPKPVDPMDAVRELLRHVDHYTNDLEVAGEDTDSDFIHIGIHKRRVSELVAAADAARKALEGNP